MLGSLTFPDLEHETLEPQPSYPAPLLPSARPVLAHSKVCIIMLLCLEPNRKELRIAATLPLPFPQ